MRLKVPPPVLIRHSRLVHVPALPRMLLDRTAGWFSRYEDERSQYRIRHRLKRPWLYFSRGTISLEMHERARDPASDHEGTRDNTLVRCGGDGDNPLSEAHAALEELPCSSRITSLDYAPRD
jgi:hypothetical protein